MRMSMTSHSIRREHPLTKGSLRTSLTKRKEKKEVKEEVDTVGVVAAEDQAAVEAEVNRGVVIMIRSTRLLRKREASIDL